MKKTAKKPHFIIGIDEVGRGPLAGPVTVAAVILPVNFDFKFRNPNIPLRDSKKLSHKQRMEWFNFIKKNKILFAISNISPKIIDRVNISRAANLAATRCAKKLTRQLTKSQINQSTVLLDGGLYINTKKLNHLNTGNLKTQTIIRGDEIIPAISLASIIAKIHRDKIMTKFHKKHPLYGFNKHKGYGTELHCKAIKKNGLLEIHRKSFLKNLKG